MGIIFDDGESWQHWLLTTLTFNKPCAEIRRKVIGRLGMPSFGSKGSLTIIFGSHTSKVNAVWRLYFYVNFIRTCDVFAGGMTLRNYLINTNVYIIITFYYDNACFKWIFMGWEKKKVPINIAYALRRCRYNSIYTCVCVCVYTLRVVLDRFLTTLVVT